MSVSHGKAHQDINIPPAASRMHKGQSNKYGREEREATYM